MFTAPVNTMFSTTCLKMDNAKMHPSMSRLLKHSSGKGEDDPGAEIALREIGERLRVTPAVMTNWKARGISKAGAIAAGAAFNCSSSWVLTGDGEPGSALNHQERSERALGATEALLMIGAAIQSIEEPKARKAATGMLHDYIDDPDANADMIPLIARRLAGEIPAIEQARRTGTN